ncbi:8733_t:CDS:2 [Funneliformis caledonium]|uniref:8733_t:CDS:1 n=1 Tax=Funneliformis caledonium TaxID=1117310 RepID=A0A9N9ALM4_9GLOM|nr:8733_t:CDS:2 [Funneliformis caledonium]
MANAQDKESCVVKVISGLNSRNKKLQDRYIKQKRNFDHEQRSWEQERKKWSQKLAGSNAMIQKLRIHNLELIDEARPEVEHKLASKVSELECLKSEAISNPVLGENDEKNMTKPDDIFAVLQSRPLGDSLNYDTYVSNKSSKNLSKYFVHEKSMDQTEKIDNDISTY